MSVPGSGELLALNGTASSGVTFTSVALPEDQILSTDMPGFVRALSTRLLLLQSAYCVGLASAAVEATADRCTGVNAVFAIERDELALRVSELVDTLDALAADVAAAPRLDALRLRLGAARAARDTTGLESVLAGGSGYLLASDTNRRQREAAFLPIQAPTEGQLRWELHLSP